MMQLRSILRACAVLTTTLAVFCSSSLRADSPPQHYEVKNGTVRATSTKLTWQQTIDQTKRSWNDSSRYCQELQLAGTGWRLPTLKELLTLVDPARSTWPVIDIVAFPDTPADLFWSANSWVMDGSYGWTVDFHMGNSAKDHAKSVGGYTRCVR